MRMKVGSLKPDYPMGLLESDAPLAGLGGVGVSVTMVGVQGIAELFRDESPTVDTVAGTCTHEWVGQTVVGEVVTVAGETDEPGRVFIHAEVDLGDGKLIHFPPYGSLAVDIEEV